MPREGGSVPGLPNASLGRAPGNPLLTPADVAPSHAGPHRLIAVVSGADAPAKGTPVHVRLDPARAHRFDADGRAIDN